MAINLRRSRWDGAIIAHLAAGPSPLAPQISLVADELLKGASRASVEARLGAWLMAHMEKRIEPLLARIAAEESLPALARELFAVQRREYGRLQEELREIEARLMAWHRADPVGRRLAQIPAIGPIIATTLGMKTPDPRAFRSGRHFAAWLGLTPTDHSTAGKTRLGKITRAGDEDLRRLLVIGATAVIQQARRHRGQHSPWLLALIGRKPPKLAAVALANKVARIAWKLMVTGESYNAARMNADPALAA